MDHWRKLERQFVSRAFRLALPNAGKSSPAKMAMTAITTRSSMSVKAHLLTGREPLATGEIPFIGFAFALVRISETANPRPVGCQAKMAVSEDKSRMTATDVMSASAEPLDQKSVTAGGPDFRAQIHIVFNEDGRLNYE